MIPVWGQGSAWGSRTPDPRNRARRVGRTAEARAGHLLGTDRRRRVPGRAAVRQDRLRPQRVRTLAVVRELPVRLRAPRARGRDRSRRRGPHPVTAPGRLRAERRRRHHAGRRDRPRRAAVPATDGGGVRGGGVARDRAVRSRHRRRATAARPLRILPVGGGGDLGGEPTREPDRDRSRRRPVARRVHALERGEPADRRSVVGARRRRVGGAHGRWSASSTSRWA